MQTKRKRKETGASTAMAQNQFLKPPTATQYEVLSSFDLRFVLRVIVLVCKSFRTCIRNERPLVRSIPWGWMRHSVLEKLVQSLPRLSPQNLFLSSAAIAQQWSRLFSFSSLTRVVVAEGSWKGWTRETIQALGTSLPLVEHFDLEGLSWAQSETMVRWTSILKKLPSLKSVHLTFSGFVYTDTGFLKRAIDNFSRWRDCFRHLPITKVTVTALANFRMWDLLTFVPLTSLCLSFVTRHEWAAHARSQTPLKLLRLTELQTSILIPSLFSSALTRLIVCDTGSADPPEPWNWDIISRSCPSLAHLALPSPRVLNPAFQWSKFPCLKSLELESARWTLTDLKPFSSLRLTHLSLGGSQKVQVWKFFFETFPLVVLKTKGRRRSTKGSAEPTGLMKAVQQVCSAPALLLCGSSRSSLERLECPDEMSTMDQKGFQSLKICFPALKTIQLPQKPGFDFDLPFPNVEICDVF